MKIVLEPTAKFVEINGARCRVWEGHTGQGVPIHAYVALIGIDRESDASELDRELGEVQPRPASDAVAWVPNLTIDVH